MLRQPHAEDVAVEGRCHQRRSLQLRDHVDERIGASPGLADAVPAGQEAGERARIDRLDLLSQRGERAPPELAEHVAVAPLPFDAIGPELAAHHPAVALEHLEGCPDRLGGQPVAPGGLRREERAVGARVARDQIDDGLRHRLRAGVR